MENSEITLKIKHLSDKVVEVKISPEATVAELKEAVAKETQIKATEQKLIFKGRVLKDADVLSDYKVEDGSSLHVVQTKSAPIQQTTNTTTSNVPTNFSSGGFGLLNSVGFSPSTNNTTNQNSPFNNPMFQSMFQSLMSNPQMLQNMINSNPMLRQMAEQNPELQQALNDPATMQMLSDPQVIQAAMGMMGRMNQGGGGTMGGGYFPMPGGSNTESTTTTTSTTTTSTQSGGTSTTTTNPNQNSQFNPFGMGLGGMGGMGGMGGGMFGGGMPNYMQMMQSLYGQPSQNQSTQNTSQNQSTTSESGTQGTTGTSTTTNPTSNFNPFMMGGFPFGSPFGGFGGFGGGMNQQQQQTQQQDNTPPEEKYKDQLTQLETMGFINKEVNLQILKSTNGNVNAAVERLLNMLG